MSEQTNAPTHVFLTKPTFFALQAIAMDSDDGMQAGEIQEFLRGPVVFSIATASHDGMPWFSRCFLIKPSTAPNQLHVYIPKTISEQPLANLAQNDRIAANGVDFTNFKSRQFKGRHIDTQSATKEEISEIQQAIETLAPMFGQFFGPGGDSGWRRYKIDPSVRLTIQLDEVYNQTPGPGAGGRLQ